jgi:hypothetical protein
MYRNDPITFFMNEVLDSMVQPRKAYRGDALPDMTATKDNPVRRPKRTTTVKWYDCWYDADGSYHEILVETGDDEPNE